MSSKAKYHYMGKINLNFISVIKSQKLSLLSKHNKASFDNRNYFNIKFDQKLCNKDWQILFDQYRNSCKKWETATQFQI